MNTTTVGPTHQTVTRTVPCASCGGSGSFRVADPPLPRPQERNTARPAKAGKQSDTGDGLIQHPPGGGTSQGAAKAGEVGAYSKLIGVVTIVWGGGS